MMNTPRNAVKLSRSISMIAALIMMGLSLFQINANARSALPPREDFHSVPMAQAKEELSNNGLNVDLENLIDLFDSHLNFLTILMTVLAGMVALIQLFDAMSDRKEFQRRKEQDEREAARQKLQDERQGRLDAAVTENAQRVAQVYEGMANFMQMQKELHEKAVKDLEDVKRREKAVEDFSRRSEEQRIAINTMAERFNNRFHRHQRSMYGMLRQKVGEMRRLASTHGLDEATLCPEYAMLSGIYAEKIDSEFSEAKRLYQQALKLVAALKEDGVEVLPELTAAIARNLGLCLHFFGNYQDSFALFDREARNFQKGEHLYRRLCLQTRLLEARSQRVNHNGDQALLDETLQQIRGEMEVLASIPEPLHHPMSREEHNRGVSYWYANLLLSATNPSAADLQKAGQLLSKDVVGDNGSVIDSLRLTHMSKQGLRPTHAQLTQAVQNCNRELAQETNISELVTLNMRLMRFHAQLGDREKVDESRAKAQAHLETIEITNRTQGELVHAFSIVTDCFRLPKAIQKELTHPMFVPVANPPTS